MRRQTRPDPWPPDLSDRAPVPLLRETFARLLDELRSRGPDAPAYTWYPPDQTVGFWYRRMAQETAVHRVDVELAHEVATPVDAELATDGVDEVLALMLAGDWSNEPVDEAAGRTIHLAAGDRSWRIRLDRTEVEVAEVTNGTRSADGAARANQAAAQRARDDATVTGNPSDVLLWLWGRVPEERLTLNRDRPVVAALRRRLALATQ
jgi:uncharacterized protein (TIGR03083 family)